MESNNIAVLINVKDRPTELAMLLQSLKYQDYKNFDVYILDDCSGTLLTNYHFINCIVTRLKEEGHRVLVKRTEYSEGVSAARHKIVQWVENTPFEYEYYLRVDDDVILEPNYITELLEVIKQGYDLASGVTVPMTQPVSKRNTKELHGVINRVIIDEKGEYEWNGDDCGILYEKKEILPAHHFRSCALYKKKIHKHINYLPTRLTQHGFREEQILSYKILQKGYKIGVNTAAINWHQLTPSGGERNTQTQENTLQNQKILEEYTKEHAKELKKLFDSTGTSWNPTILEKLKQVNLTMRPK